MAKTKLEDIIASINQNTSTDETAEILDDLQQEKYGNYFKTRGKISTPADLSKLGEVRLDEAARNYLANNPNRSIIPGASSQVEEGFGIKPFTPREIENTQFTLGPSSEAKNARLDALREFAEKKGRSAIESNRFQMKDSPQSSSSNLDDIKNKFKEQKNRSAIESNRFEMRQGPTVKPEGLTKEETIAAFKKARADKIKAIEEQKQFSDIALIQKSWDRMAEKLGRNPTFLEVFDDMGGRASEASGKVLGKLGAIASSKPAQILTRGVIAPLAAYEEGKSALESAKKGEYTDALSSGLGAASAVAGIAGSSAALPLAAGSLGIAGGKELGKKQAELADEGIFYDPTEGYARLDEDLIKVDKNFKPVDYKKNAISEDELENLSNPEMVEKEKREKIVKDAVEMSKMNNKNYSDVQHQMVGMQALENYDKGKKLKENVGEFFSNLFKKDPEDIQKAKAEERQKYIKLNEQRIAAGLSPLEIPAGLEEKKYTPTEEDSKPYQFKTKQLAATPAKSSGLSEEGLKFDDLLKQYANYDYKDNLKDISDEELNELAKGRGEKRNISYIAQTPEGYQGPSPEEVKAEAVNVAKKLNQNPAMFLGQIDQESSFNPFAVSKTGAKGLGQMFPAAYTDAQKMDKEGILKNVPYREMIKPENWKLQLYAAGLYNNWIDKYMTKGAGDEARLKWYSGGADEEKAKARGTDPSAYAKAVFRRAKKFEKELGEQIPTAELKDETAPKSVARNPAGVMDEESEDGEIIPQVTDRTSLDKVQKLKSIQNFLRGDTSDTPLSFGPYSDTEAGRNLYASGIKDQDRLLTLKKKYDQMMMDKGKTPSGESINFVPVDGEDGKPANFVPVEGPDGQPMPSESTPSATPPQESAPTAPSTSAQKQVENIINQQTNLKEELLRAQNAAAENKFYANLARAATQIATGAAGLKGKVSAKMPDTGVFEDLQKQADIPVTELEQRIKIEGEDPNSEVSNSMRSILEQDLKDIGVKANLSGLSYNQMKEIYSPISNRMSRLEADKRRKEDKEEAKESRKDENFERFKERQRDDLKQGDLGKEITRFHKLDQGISMFEGKGGESGARNLAEFFAYMKAAQNDDSVIRDSEQKLGLQLGGFKDRIRANLIKFFKGEFLTPEVKKQMLGILKTQQRDLRRSIGIQISPFYEQFKNQPKMKGKSEDEVLEEWQQVSPMNFDFNEVKTNQYIKDVAEKGFNGNIQEATKYLKEKGYIK